MQLKSGTNEVGNQNIIFHGVMDPYKEDAILFKKRIVQYRLR